MTNLSDLFPAGAGKQVSFTASGNVTGAGKPVVLNSDGTVSAISSSASNVGSQDQFSPTTVYVDVSAIPSTAMCYDTSNDRFIVAFKNANNSNALTVVAASISGTNFTWGTPVAVAFTANSNSYGIAFDTLRNCFVVVCQENSNLRCYTGTVSGTTITVNSGSALTVSAANYTWVKAIFDATNNKTLLMARDSSSDGQCFAISVDAAYAPTTSSAYNFTNSQNIDNSSIGYNAAYDPDQGVVLIGYRGPSSVGYVNLVDCSGSNPTGTHFTNTSWSSSGFGGCDIAYDTANNQFVLSVYDSGNSYYLSYQAITATGKTTLTFGTKVTQTTANTQFPLYMETLYDTNAGAIVCTYEPNYSAVYAQKVTLSGTSPVIDSSLLTIVSNAIKGQFSGVYDPDTNQLNIAYVNTPSTDEGYAKAFNVASTNLTATNFIGISDAAITSAASGNITIKGGIAATGLSSLTPASDYYVQDDGTITTVSSDVKAGKALSATAINLEYTS